MPEPNRAQRGVREPSEPEQLLSASLRGLLRTRKTRTGLGPRRHRRRRGAHVRPPAPLAPLASSALPGLARGTLPGRAEWGGGGDRLPALGARSCSVPLCLRSPCQPARGPVFVFTSKGSATKVEKESEEQTKEGEGAGKQSCLLGLRGGEEPVEKRNTQAGRAKAVRLSQELCNFSQPWPLRLNFRPSA